MKMQCTSFGNDIIISSSHVIISDNCKESITVWFFYCQRFSDIVLKLGRTYPIGQEAQLSLTNRAMLVCKVVEVWQEFLSEYVDKKFTRDYNVIMYLSIFNSFRAIRCLSQCVSPKIAIFIPHFCFPWGCPWGNHAKCCIGGKIIRCLQIVSLHVPI